MNNFNKYLLKRKQKFVWLLAECKDKYASIIIESEILFNDALFTKTKKNLAHIVKTEFLKGYKNYSEYTNDIYKYWTKDYGKRKKPILKYTIKDKDIKFWLLRLPKKYE